jgi:hypothetical protein
MSLQGMVASGIRRTEESLPVFQCGGLGQPEAAVLGGAVMGKSPVAHDAQNGGGRWWMEY